MDRTEDQRGVAEAPRSGAGTVIPGARSAEQSDAALSNDAHNARLIDRPSHDASAQRDQNAKTERLVLDRDGTRRLVTEETVTDEHGTHRVVTEQLVADRTVKVSVECAVGDVESLQRMLLHTPYIPDTDGAAGKSVVAKLLSAVAETLNVDLGTTHGVFPLSARYVPVTEPRADATRPDGTRVGAVPPVHGEDPALLGQGSEAGKQQSVASPLGGAAGAPGVRDKTFENDQAGRSERAP